MRIKLDENMPTDLAALLRGADLDVHTVQDENLAGSPDPTVLDAAVREGRLLMTFDLDFADVRDYPPGSHAGIVVFRLRDQRWATLEGPARRVLASGLLDGLDRGLAVVDHARVRVRRPSPRQ